MSELHVYIIGEVLVQEDALAATTKLDATLRSHCSTCLRRCPTPLPCPTCSLVGVYHPTSFFLLVY